MCRRMHHVILQLSLGEPSACAAGSDSVDAVCGVVERCLRSGASAAPLRFADLGGIDEVATAMHELVTLPLTQPEVFARYGLKPPRGVLLHGPPGSGKTVLARCAAHEAEATLMVRIIHTTVQTRL